MHPIVTKLRKLNILLSVKDGKLRINDRDEVITSEIVEEIKHHKDELIAWINSVSGERFNSIQKAGVKDFYHLSSAQRRLYFLYQYDKSSIAYNSPQVLWLEGHIDAEKIKSVFRQLIDRHEILRTSFGLNGEEVIQRIQPRVPFDIEIHHAAQEQVDVLIRKCIRPFDLGTAPLLRVHLIMINAGTGVLIVDMHHIITDGVSRGILVREFMSLYNDEKLPVLNIQYKDYGEWQYQQTNQQQTVKQREFWLNEFSPEWRSLELITDYPRTQDREESGAAVKFRLSQQQTRRLTEIAGEHKTSLFMLLLSFYYILLSKLSGNEDIIIGTTTSGRDHADLEQMMGVFVNTLPLRNYPFAHLGFKDFLQQVKKVALASFDNQAYSYDELVNDLQLTRDAGRNPLFDVMFAYYNFEIEELKIPGLALKPYEVLPKVAQFDLTLSAMEKDGSILLQFEYATTLFSEDSISRLAAYYQRIADIVISDPSVKLGDISLLSASELEQQLYAFNNTQVAYDTEATVVSLFDACATDNPDAIAVMYKDQELSYGSLKDRSARVGAYLQRRYGLQADDLVGILSSRNIELIIMIMGVLKSGAAYVPIDPSYPAGRRDAIINDSGMKLLITDHPETAVDCEVCSVEELLEAAMSEEATDHTPHGNDLAYVIYTSGSTGRPKGVMIEHQSVANYIRFAAQQYASEANSSFGLYTSVSFDLTVTSIFTPLITGNRIVVYEEKEGLQILEVFSDARVDVIKLTPSHLKLVAESTHLSAASVTPKRLIVGGENFEMTLAAAIDSKFEGKIKIYNEYGPTETTVGCMIHEYHFLDPGTAVPLGVPIANSQIYLLDKDMHPVPPGVRGELYISGAGVGRGYLFNEEQTRRSFIPNPFIEGQRLYKTGDHAIRYADGSIVYVGRADEQVKIRGYRIEPGEIEMQLYAHAAITAAVVSVREKGDEKYLVAHYAAAQPLDADELREMLSQKLPQYMIPLWCMWLPQLPLTVNGKVDRSKLPDWEPEINDTVPLSNIELRLRKIWAEVIEVDEHSIDVRKSFFELGGHSLKATILVNRIFRDMNVEIPVKEIFRNQNIISQAAFIQNAIPSEYTPIEKISPQPFYTLSSAQKRLHFMYEMDKSSLAYNLPNIVRLQDDTDIDRVNYAFRTLIERHESLRTVFEIHDDRPVQRVLDVCPFEVSFISSPGRPIEDIGREFMYPFELSEAPLLRAMIVKNATPAAGGPAADWLVVDMHHIITDAVSNDILLDEFRQLYAGLELPAPGLQYKDYAGWQQMEHQHEKIREQELLWLVELDGYAGSFELPYDYRLTAQMEEKGAGVGIYLTEEETRLIRKYKEDYHVTTGTLFYAMYCLLLSRVTDLEDMVIGFLVSGRRHSDLERVVGFFVNILAIRSYPAKNKSVADYIAEVKETILRAYDIQDFQFDDLVDSLNLKRIPGRNPLFNVLLNVLEKVDRNIPLSDNPDDYKHASISKRFDLTLNVKEYNNTFLFQLQYNAVLFKAGTAENFLRSLRHVIRSLEHIGNGKISGIKLLGEQEKEAAINAVLLCDEKMLAGRKRIPASYHHERLWFIDRFESGYLYKAGPVYHNIPLILNFSGEVDPALLEAAVNRLLKRHTVLRTQLVSVEDRVYQQVLPYAPILLKQGITDGPLEDTQRISTAFTEKAFNMDGLLLRGLLLQQPSAERYQLVLVFHHLIADRHSIKRWRDELLNIYGQLASGKEPEEVPVAVDYRGFSIWQQERFSLLEFELLPYWRRQLGRGVKALDLPTDRARAAVHIYQSALKAFRLPATLIEQLHQFASERGFSVKILLLAGFNVLLGKYSRQEEIVVGTVAGNREIKPFRDIAGPLSNLIVLRSYVYGNRSFAEYCTALQSLVQEAEEHGLMPFDKLVKELGLEKDMSRTALFDVLFQYEEDEPLQKKTTKISVHEQENNLGYGKYDLNLLMQSGEQDINAYLVYNACYFDSSTIDTFVSRYLLLLERLLSSPAIPVSRVEMISTEERQELLSKLDRSKFAYPADQTLVSLFRKQVQLQGRRTAVKDSQEELSYEELDIRSEVLSQELRRRGVKRNSIVGLLMDRQAATVTGMLAILKAGGAYLPVDVEYPADRINWQLQDSGCKVVVTHSSFTDLVQAGLEVVLLDEVYDNAPLNEENPQPQDLCYVIYTSGTTGRPKGVMVEHRNVVSLLFNEGFEYDFGPDDVWSMFHSHCFDFSVWEIYGALLYGGRVVVLSLEQARDTQVSLSLLRSEGVTVLNQTPSSFYALSEADTTDTLNLRYVIFGGEALNPERLEAWHKRYPQVKLMNMYGITETTVHVTIKEIGDTDIRDKVSNIGVPIATMRICLLDEHMQVVPQGIAGELYVGGAGVSRGYLGREELTAARFVSDLYQPGERLYRSGDLARLLPSGELSYLGRIDQQVQLRGYRIELGEIDSRLQEHDSIRECTTRLWETEDDKCLATYYVSDKELKAGELRSFLSEKLPEYMVPSYFMRLPSLPLTANGKLDRNALPAPEVATEDEYVAPVGPIQEKLVEIWSEVLKIDRSAISTRSNFFELGGHSLKAAVLVNKIKRNFSVEMPLKDIFIKQTIIQQSEMIETDKWLFESKVEDMGKTTITI